MAHDHDVLYFGFSTEPPTIRDATVHDRLERRFLDVPFQFEVLGSSHHVYSTSLGFHEVSSSEPVEGGDVYGLELAAGIDREFAFGTGPVQARAAVWTAAPSAVPDDRSCTIRHEFDGGRVTAIDVGDRYYETYHAYPDAELAVRSRTVFPGR